MRSRWMSMAALVMIAGLALAMAAPAVPSQPVATGQAVLGAAAPAPDTTAGDPYLAQSPFTTEAPEPVATCQVYAYQCVFDGGPCGPGGFCHCQYRPTGWICGR